MKLHSADWPLFGWITDMLPRLERARVEGRSVVLGTLIDIQGSTPRPAGSQMLFDGDEAVGYFSGGCLEADIANHAEQVLADGEPRVLVYGTGSPWIDIRLLCGGRLDIMLERIAPDDAAIGTLIALAAQRRRVLLTSDGHVRHAQEASLDEPDMQRVGDGYRLCLNPTWRLMLVGGDPIALAIAQLGALSGFATTIVRPNGPVEEPPFPGVTYRRGDAAVAVEEMAPDRWTAIISATHDEDIDDAALIAALRADTGYVGVLGAGRRAGLRRERLVHAGLSPTRVAALHAPIGIARCGKAPWEVAVSVIAEIMQARTEQAVRPIDQGERAVALSQR